MKIVLLVLHCGTSISWLFFTYWWRKLCQDMKYDTGEHVFCNFNFVSIKFVVILWCRTLHGLNISIYRIYTKNYYYTKTELLTQVYSIWIAFYHCYSWVYFGKQQYSSNNVSCLTRTICIITNVFFFFLIADFLPLRSFLLLMPEKLFLALMNPSTKPLSKSASGIKQPICLCPICQLKLLFLKKMDGLRITFHRLLLCPHII